MPAVEAWLWRWVLEGSSVIGLKSYRALNQWATGTLFKNSIVGENDLLFLHYKR